MIQTYWLKTKTNSNTPTNQLEHKMDQDLNPWRVKNTWTATRQTHNLLHDCTFNTIHHLNNSWAWAIDAETTINKKAISGTELMDKLIHQMAVWPLRGTPTGRRNGPTAIWEFCTGKCQVLQQGKNNPMHWYIGKELFFYLRGDSTWRALSRQVVVFPSLEVFKTWVDTALNNLLYLALLWVERMDEMISRGPFLDLPPQHSVIIYHIFNENADL